MSTSYKLGWNFGADEASAKIQLWIDDNYVRNFAEELDAVEMRKVIVKLIHILSYISDDPNEPLNRFNVDYRDSI